MCTFVEAAWASEKYHSDAAQAVTKYDVGARTVGHGGGAGLAAPVINVRDAFVAAEGAHLDGSKRHMLSLLPAIPPLLSRVPTCACLSMRASCWAAPATLMLMAVASGPSRSLDNKIDCGKESHQTGASQAEMTVMLPSQGAG